MEGGPNACSLNDLYIIVCSSDRKKCQDVSDGVFSRKDLLSLYVIIITRFKTRHLLHLMTVVNILSPLVFG